MRKNNMDSASLPVREIIINLDETIISFFNQNFTKGND